MKLVSLTTPAFFAIALTCAACATENAADYGYEFASDQTSAPAQTAPEQSSGIEKGRLAPELIQATVRSNFPAIRACYETALQQAPDLTGRVEVRFHIQHDGSVTGAQSTDQSTIADQAMIQCVVAVIQGATFPETEGGVVDVVYPIMFSPGE
jgi:hypothetical protein